MYCVKWSWASDNVWPSSVSVHAGYCPWTFDYWWWFSHSLCTGSQRWTSGFFSHLYLVLENASHWTGCPQIELEWPAMIQTGSSCFCHPPSARIIDRYVFLHQAISSGCLGWKMGPHACTAGKHSAQWSVFLVPYSLSRKLLYFCLL